MKSLVKGFLVIILLATSAYAEEGNRAVEVAGVSCKQGMHHQPNGPFAVMVFCEDALGTYAGVICADPGKCEPREYTPGVVSFAGWDLGDRFWQDKSWASDVTSFIWSADGKTLFIATSGIYGSGGLYRLDLEERKTTQLLPVDKVVSSRSPVPGYALVALEGQALLYKYGPDPEEADPVLSLSLQD